jgi:hypothetical protein
MTEFTRFPSLTIILTLAKELLNYYLKYDATAFFQIVIYLSCIGIHYPMSIDPRYKQQTNKLHGLSPRVNYTNRATAACRRSDCQLLRIKGATWSA